MKYQINSSPLIHSSLALAIALAMWTPIQSQSADPVEGKAMMTGKMMEQRQEMKAKREKMVAKMKAQDAELTEQIAKMNSAPEDKKLDLLSAVVTRMVEQRTAMHAQMETMHEEMMEHMQSGGNSMPHGSMMKGDAKKTAGDHKELHAE